MSDEASPFVQRSKTPRGARVHRYILPTAMNRSMMGSCDEIFQRSAPASEMLATQRRTMLNLSLLALVSARASIGGSMGGRSLEDGSGSHMIPEATSWNEGTIRPPASEVPSASPRGFAVRKRPWDEATTAATMFGDGDSFGGAHGSGGAGRMARSGSCMAAAAGISMAFIETEASAAELEEGRQNVYVHVHVHATETPASLRAQIAAVRESTREIEAEAQRIEEEEAAAIEAGQHAQRQAAAAYAAAERAARAARAASVQGPKMRRGATEVTAEEAAATAVKATAEEATAEAAEEEEATAAEATAAEGTVAEVTAVSAETAMAAVEVTAEAEELVEAAVSVAAASEAEADGGRGDDASRGGGSGGGGGGGGGSDDDSGGGSDDDESVSAEGKAADAAHDALLARVAELRVSAKGARRVERWADALAGYAEACSLLEGGAAAGTVAATGGAQAEATSTSMAAPSVAAPKVSSPGSRRDERQGRLAAELQACRLSGALCAYQLEHWGEVIRLCGAALRANPSCAAALYRRGLALQADGQVEAAAWDLQQAARLQPNNAKHKAAAARAEAAAAAARPLMRRGSLGAHHGAGAAAGAGGSSIDEMMQQMMSSLGGSGGTVPGAAGGLGAGGLSALLGGLGAGSGAGGAAGAGGLMSLLGSGLSGAAAGGAASEDGPSPLEALLRSPLLSASGLGGKGTSRMMGLLARALAAQRVAKRLYRRLKPFLPFLFWVAVLLPVLITFRQQLAQLAPWKWVTQYVPAGLLPASLLGGPR